MRRRKKYYEKPPLSHYISQGVAEEGLVSRIPVLLPGDRAKWRFIVMDTHRGGAGAAIGGAGAGVAVIQFYKSQSISDITTVFRTLNSLETLGQTVESPKVLSANICPREVLRVIRLIPQGTSCGDIFHTIPKYFPLFVRLWASKTKDDEAQSCPMCLSGETEGSDLPRSDSVKSRRWWLKNKV